MGRRIEFRLLSMRAVNKLCMMGFSLHLPGLYSGHQKLLAVSWMHQAALSAAFCTCCSLCLKWLFFLVLREISSLPLQCFPRIPSSGQMSLPLTLSAKPLFLWSTRVTLYMLILQHSSYSCGHLLIWLFHSIIISSRRTLYFIHLVSWT